MPRTSPERGGPPGRLRPLDGLRGVAVLLVLCFHAQALAAGYVGVDVFFVLSGFLITGLLLAEHARTGAVDLRAFWVRRALRLWPALHVYLVAGLLLLAAVKSGDELRHYLITVPGLLLGAGNWWEAIRAADCGAWNEHLWSLGVEQQFYVVWPPVLLGLLASRRRLPLWGALAGLLVLVAGWRAAVLLLGGSGERVYLGTDTRVDALLAGALVAVLAADGVLARVPATVWTVVAGAGVLGLAAIAVAGPGLGPDPTWVSWGGFTLIAVLAALVVAAVAVVPGGPLARLLAARPLVRLGEISYAFYLWHYPVVIVFGGAVEARAGRPAAVVASIGGSAILAELSRRLVEDPVARRRSAVLARLRRPPAAPPPITLPPGTLDAVPSRTPGTLPACAFTWDPITPGSSSRSSWPPSS